MAPRIDVVILLAAAVGSSTMVALALPVANSGKNTLSAASEAVSITAEIQNPFAFEPDALIAAQPFGSSPRAEMASTQAVVTPSQIKLLGVLASSTETRSWAVLSVNDAEPSVFRLGDQVAEGSSLKSVLPTHVVIEHFDRIEEIYLAADEQAEGVQVQRQAAPQQVAVNTDFGLEALAKMAPANPTYGQPTVELDNSIDGIIARYREAVRVNPTSVRMRLGVQKTDQGYVVQGVTAPIMLRAGFRPGDVITKINGELVSGVNNEVELYDRVVSSSIAQVELIRNGETIVKSFPIP